MTSDVATEEQPLSRPAPGPQEDDTTWTRALARFNYRPPRVRGMRERLSPSYTDSSAYTGGGWVATILITVMAGILRFWNLGQPRAVIFDETYYAKDGWSLLKLGYEGSWTDEANKEILAGNVDKVFKTDPSYIVHPPVGKWVIGLGENFFGLTPFGWRFAVAVLGTLSVLMIIRIGRRLFRSTLLGCVAGLLLSLDGLHFVMSRTALLDLVLMFWILGAFGALLIDRDQTRETLAKRLKEGVDPVRAMSLGFGLRPWRLVAGILLGLACATKWSGMYYLAVFGVMTVLWDVGTRRAAGAPRPYVAVLRRDVPWAFLSTVPVAIVVYIWSWSGWFLTDKGYYRDWAAGRDTSFPFIPDALRSLWHYHTEMWQFHTNLGTPHPYESNSWSWLVLGRPVSYSYETVPKGTDGCGAKECAQEVLGIGTPLLWWTGVVAVAYLLYRWAARRDWRAGAVLGALCAGWLPWMFYQDRTIFLFYAVVFVPFLVLAVTMLLGAILGPPDASDRRRTWGIAGVVAIVVLIAWNFLYFYPILSGQTIPMDEWRDRMWLTTWI